MRRSIIVYAHNIRSTHNVGSILRTSDGLGVDRVVFSGYTPYPSSNSDQRLPHIAKKINSQIHKTALGAETTVKWDYQSDPVQSIQQLKDDNYKVYALEQRDDSIALPGFKPGGKIVLILGEEVNGVEPSLLGLCDEILEIPMFGSKESFNVSVAAGIALYHFQFSP